MFFFDPPTPTTDGRPRKWGYVLPREKKITFQRIRAVLWPTSLLFSLFCRYQGFFSRGQSGCCANLTVQFHLAPELGIRRVTFPLPRVSSWCEQEKYSVSSSIPIRRICSFSNNSVINNCLLVFSARI